ncbi:piggyBac transposable element-derived protein 4-like [Hyposmocoma kahamanoa]|uniref:piggyBac transposable element-derived protein 4-like n=1 Tax=Hyposmocoma kahamanoa TaxID=1477025 RepID=UPI000E6D772E|nr:piggyBac transposable element-derived protein 4-like [Hyposmocoma kahamanoa]XP_026327937.1 piggyBac transposable element-derived protein 4-like [Hyposmocoma kahamanoa]
MNIEAQENRIRAMLEEVETDSSYESSSEGETDHCSDHNVNSDTEQEADDPVDLLSNSGQETVVANETYSDSDDDVPLSALGSRMFCSRQVGGSYYSSKDGTKWYKNCQRPNIRLRSENIVTERALVKTGARDADTESKCWNIFVTQSMLDETLLHTNSEIRRSQVKSNDPNAVHKKEITMSELKAFIGLLYIAGVTKSNRQNLKDLWRTDGTGVDVFRTTMSLQRFYFLQNSIRFDDKSTREERKKTDNMAAIRSMFDQFVQCCQNAYTPSEFLTIDEMLLSFRGRCLFRVYIPNKPAKYGLKIFALVDAKSFYVLNLEVYAGKQPLGPYAVSNTAFDVVERLIQPVSRSHRNVTFDNWFTSYTLMLHLLNEHRLTSTGTVRKNKRQIPDSFTRTGREPATSLFGFQKDITIVSYAPKKNKVVIAMSTMHHDNSIDQSTGEKNKPEIITFYNSTKAGVDVVDELSASYNVSRNSKRWPMTLFYGILNMASINAYIIYQANKSATVKRTEFIRNLGLSLIYEHLESRKEKKNIPFHIRQRITSQLGDPTPGASANMPGRYVRCRECPNKKDRKTKYICNTCAKPICMEHAKFLCQNCADLN